MEFETLAEGLYLEALLIDGDDIWYSDVVAGGVCRLSPDGVTRRWLDGRQWIGGLLMNEDGRLLVAGPGGIVWLDPATGRTGTVLDTVAGVPLPGINEMRPDGAGGLYCGTVDVPAIIRGERPRPAALHRLLPDLSARCLVDGLRFTNGLNLAPDGRRLFVNESFAAVTAYRVDADGGLSGRTEIAAKPDCDGMAMDAGGGLWISGFSSDHLLRLDSDGREMARVPVPGPAATNVRFGGDDMRDLYVTLVDPATAAGLARGELPTVPTSRLCRARSPVAGAIIPRTRLRLPG